MAFIGTHRLDLVADAYTIGHAFSTADTPEVLIAKPDWAQLAVVKVIANVPTGLTSPSATLLDGSTEIGQQTVSAGEIVELLDSAIGLPIDGDLQAKVSNTNITVSAWVLHTAVGG